MSVSNFIPTGRGMVTSLFFGNLQVDSKSAIYRLNLKTNQLTTLPGSEGKWWSRTFAG